MEEKTIFKKVVNTNGVISCDELDITVEEWKKVLQDSLVYNNYKLWLARFYQEVEHKATCKYMGEKYKCSSQTPNSVITKFGIAARKILNRFEIQEADGSQTYWVIPMKKDQTVSGAFEWTMRDELVQAMEELGMTDPEEFEGKRKTLKTWQEIYDESRWLKNDWNNKYLETVNIIRENVENVHWTEDCIYRLLKSSGNGISSVNWGLSNEHFEIIKQNWNFYEEKFNKICIEKHITQELIKSIMDKTQELTGKTYSLIINRAICGLLPGIMTTAPGLDFFYERINVIKDIFPETLEITENWVEDNLNFVSYCKTQVEFKEEYHASGFIFDLYDYCKSLQGDTQMTQEKSLVSKYTDLLRNTKNIILTGAPGTGKTFMAKQIAKELGCKDDNIGFVQFHPSYDYTDFVEGLRPTDKDGNGNVGFERRDGVFKKFCEKAILSSSVTEDIWKELNENPTIWKVSLEKTGDNPTRTDCLKNGYIRLGWANYGDVADFSNFSGYTELGGSVVLVAFQSKMKVGDIVLSCYSATEIDAVGIVTGDYEYRPEGGDYPRYRTVKWIVKGIKENIVEKNHGKTLTLASVYKLSVSIKDVFDIVEKNSTNQTLSSDSQEKTSNSPYVFIIDEINRGEVAKIFGELFYCVDPGYRGEKGKINTQYQNLINENNIFHSGFFIPENVYIIGTMNDIDRSVESMDFAFRRRFSWIEVKASDTVDMLDPKYDDNGELISGLEKDLAKKAKRRMENLNAAIWNEKENKGIEGLNEAYHIGASYFLKLKNYDGDFESLWNYHIKGILQEYLRGSGNEAKIDELKAAYDKEKEN